VNTPGENPAAAAVERLLDLAQQGGFSFTPAGEDGALWGERTGPGWLDVVFISASGPCNAVRSRRGHRAPDEPLFITRITGTALTVLHTVISWPMAGSTELNENAETARNGQTQQTSPPRGTGEIVDIRTGQRHLLTPNAIAAGQQATGHRCRALCGTEIQLAALVDPGTGYCWPCQSTPSPRGGK